MLRKFTLLFWLCLVSLALADVPPSVTTAESTADLVSRLYHQAGPRIGCSFVEPDVVLTLGNLRGSNDGWTHVSPSQTGDAMVLEGLNKTLVPLGLHIRPIANAKEESLLFEVQSLPGLARVLQESHLMGARAMRAPGTFKGWGTEKQQAILAGNYGAEQAQDMIRGLYLGYPDRAILDFVGWLKEGRRARMVSAEVDKADYYEGPQPIWDMRPDSISDPQVMATQKRWSDFLTRFYASPAQRKLAAEPEFLAARKQHLLSWDTWLAKYRDIKGSARSPERTRLGL